MLTTKRMYERTSFPQGRARAGTRKTVAFRKISLPALAFALCLALSAAAHADTIVMSTFDTDADGWTAVTLNGSTVSAPVGVTWNSTGGNPDGFISRSDFGSGTWYFNAPVQFLGDKLAAYDGRLNFDFKYTGSGSVFNAGDVRLTGVNGLVLVLDMPPPLSAGVWTPMSALLNESAGWRIGSLTGALATQEQMLSVLANIAGLHIRGEFISGSDSGRLDNVALESVPEPAALALMGSGVAGLAFFMRRKRRLHRKLLTKRYECLRFDTPAVKSSWHA